MDMTAEVSGPQVHLGFFDKVRIVVACLVAVLLMRTVGWMVAGPVDPHQAVTFALSERSLLALWPGILVLTVVSAVLGTVIAGPRVAEAGALAAGVGLTGLALRGGSMAMALGYSGNAAEGGRRLLMIRMMVDCLLWAIIMAVAWAACLLAWRWLWGNDRELVSGDSTAPPRSGTRTGPVRVTFAAGWPALAVTAVVALFFIWLTIAPSPVANIARGQVIASVGAGLFLGAMAARYFLGIDDPRWYALAPLLVALVGYLLGYINAGMGWAVGTPFQPYAALATTPPHDLVRPLPIEYIGVGVAGAIAGFWSGEKIEHAAE